MIVTQVGKYSSSSQSISETFTCLDSEGNIELIRHPYGNSLYCSPERAREWKEVFHDESFSHRVYYRCPSGEDYDQIYDEDVIQIEAQGPYVGDNLLVCPEGQKNIASPSAEAICG